MKHHKKNRKFGRDRAQRKALIKSLVLALVKEEKIKTTEAKAKELRPHIEKMITKARNNSLSTRRQFLMALGSELAAQKLLKVLGPRYASRKGGYTRITKMADRKSDSGKLAIIEFV